MSTISGTITHSITLATTGIYASPLTIAATGTVSNNGTGDAIYGPATNAWTVTNLGRVSATGSYDGVDLRAGGLVTNGSTSDTTALIVGGVGSVGFPGKEAGGAGGVGISVAGSAGIASWGTITGGSGGAGGGYGGRGGEGGAGIRLSGGGSIGNWGTIAGGGGGSYGGAGGDGINGSGGGEISNSGVIAGAGGGSIGFYGIGGAGGAGINLTGGGSIGNSGVIAGGGGSSNGGAGSIGGAGGAGINLTGGGSIGNSGTIAGGAGGSSGYGTDGASGGIAIAMSGGGTIVNRGLIAGGNGGGGGIGSDAVAPGDGGNGGAGIMLSGVGGIANWGTIAGGNGGPGNGGPNGFIQSGPGAAGAGIILSAIGSIANWGAIVGGQHPGTDAGAAVVLSAGGTVINGSAGDGAALIEGSFGIEALGAAGVSVTNFGTVAGFVGGAGVPIYLDGGSTGGAGGIGISLAGGGRIANSGVIAGGDGGIGGNAFRVVVLDSGKGGGGGNGGAGIVLSAFGIIANSGTIAGGQGGAGGTGSTPGASGAAGPGIILNDGGVVTNGSSAGSAALITGGIGIQALGTAAATVTNFGTIEGTGGIAVAIGNGAAGKVIVEPGAVFLGKVLGGGNSEIEFAAAGVAGMSNVSGFATIGLLNGHSHSLNLTDANFGAVSGRVITVNGGNAGDTVDAAALPAADRIIVHAGTGNDQLSGGAGNDTFEFSAASLKSTDVVKGGFGTDRLVMTSAGAVAAAGVNGVETFQLAGGGANSLTLADANFAGVTGTTITVDGGNAGNTLKAGALTSPNRVIVTGGGGNDQLTGGAGNDIFEFSAANLATTDVVKGGLGTDRLVMMSAGAVAAAGVSGVEIYSLSDGGASSLLLTNANFAGVSGTAITVDGSNGGNTVNASTVTGSNRVVLIGGFAADSFIGGAGNDIFQFAAANLTAADTVQGRSGSDQLRMTSPGTIAAFGVSGVETYSLANGGANSLTLTDANFDGVSGAAITVDGGNGGNTVNASALTGSNRVIVVGGAGKDIFTGGAGNDIFHFTVANLAASDTVKGGAGIDQLVMTTAGTVLAGGVSAVETYALANGGANSLTLVNANFSGVTGRVIRVNGGNAGNMVDASALTGANRVVVVGGAGNDTFKFSAASLQSTDVVKGGLGTDRLVMMSAGAVAAAGVSGVEIYSLSDGGASSLLLTNANFAGVSGTAITVDGSNGGNTVNASTVTGSNRVVLIGGFAADSFIGGAGNDIFQFAAANLTAADTVQGRSGSDQLRMTSPGTIAAFGVSGVETYSLANGGANSLTLTDANFDGVSGAAITVDGGNGGNTVNASALTGSNRVIVVGGAGKDIFTGGAGNDIFHFTVANLAASDTVKGGAGSDQLVMTSAGTVLAGGVSAVETYALANGGANSLTLVNANFSGVTGSTITVDGGNAGNMVDASALTGANRVVVVGGAGNDTFKFSAASLQSTDVVRGGLGTDRLVMTSAGAVAAAGVSGVETFQLAGGGANSLTLADANFAGATGTTITVEGGNAGNTLKAGALTSPNRVIVTGGGGNDQLTGGAGNDTFKFSAANLQSTDVVKGGLGTDRLVMTSAGAVAAAGVSGVEIYALSDGGASSLLLTNANFAGVSGATIRVDGSNGGNTINASTVTGSNRVILIGGFAADSFTGGAGNDIFQFAAANLTAADTVQGRSGSDQLRMTSPGTIAAFGVSGVETYSLANGGANSLTLTDANFDGVSGAAITVDGGNGGNTVNASALTGSNRVIVVGSTGADTLITAQHAAMTGGGGADLFELTAPGSATVPDTNMIADFTHASDRIAVSNAGFGLGLAGASTTPQALPASLFSLQSNGSFTTTAQRFAYNSASGALYFDADGSGAGASRLIASLTHHPTLAAADMTFVS